MSTGRLRLYIRRNYYGTLHRAVYPPKIKETLVRIAHLCKEGQCSNKVEEEQVKLLHKYHFLLF